MGLLALLAVSLSEGPLGLPDLRHDIVPAYGAPALAPVRAEDRAAQPAVLYLNFSDGTETIARAISDDASRNESIIGAVDPFPEFRWQAFSSAGNTRPDVVRAIAERAHRAFLSFNVVLTTVRPADTPYTMVMIGGAPAVFGLPKDVAGLAPLDCGNRQPSDIVYAFSSALEGATHGLFVTIAQEAAHAYGLEHTTNRADLMFPQVVPEQSSFPEEEYPLIGQPLCGRLTQSSHGLLVETLGAWTDGEKPPPRGPPRDTTAPVITIDEPLDGAVLPADFVVRASAEDDVGIRRVTIEAAGDHATLEAPPYTWFISRLPPGPVDITVTAIDDAGQMASATVSALVADAAPEAPGCATAPPGSGRNQAPFFAPFAAATAILACVRRRRHL